MRTMRILTLVLCAAAGVGCSQGNGSGSVLDLTSTSPDGGRDGGLSDLQSVDAGSFSFSEPFAGADTAPWPTRWTVLGGVTAQSQQAGRGRLVPLTSGYSLARMGTTEGASDIEVTFQVQFENIATQGVGYYVRQNGGWLRGTAVHGQGYAVFVEGFRGSRLGVWKEVDGQEIEIMPFTSFGTPLQSNLLYQVRLRVTQAASNLTRLQARLWLAAQAEPTTWQLDTTDATPSLQNVSGGMAVDSYSSQTTGTITAATLVDNIIAGPPG